MEWVPSSYFFVSLHSFSTDISLVLLIVILFSRTITILSDSSEYSWGLFAFRLFYLKIISPGYNKKSQIKVECFNI